jgi:hypothetical protein
VTISEEDDERTAHVLAELTGFNADGNEGNRFRYRAGCAEDFAAVVDLLCTPGGPH